MQYQSSTGQRANLEVDINFMFRFPLWPVVTMDSKQLGAWQAKGISVLDIHELAAGKLAALFSRRQARDLFDCHKILHSANLDHNRLRVVAECQESLTSILPFTDSEQEFLNLLLDKGQIAPKLLTDDTSFQERIQNHPKLN